MQDEKGNMKRFKRSRSGSRSACFIRDNPLGELLEERDKRGTKVVLSSGCRSQPQPAPGLRGS